MKSTVNKKLLLRTITRYFIVLLFTGMLLFLPAGTFAFRNAWIFIGVLFIPMFFVLIYLIINDPGLLEKRMKTDEKEKPQKVYLVLSLIVTVIIYIVPGLDYRNNWSSVPMPVVIGSTVFVLIGYLMFFIVMKQNSYASRVIEIQKEQKLIETGLYSVVRHPMYLAATILFGFSPLVLGSYYALIPMLFIPILLIIRIKNEEKVLMNGLKGYDEYMKKVRYRIIPYIW
jgi:protein-S-isoprenylcysteine O-methyltransferase Ste14